MTLQMAFVLGLLVLTMGLFVTERLRLDIVALLVLLSLMLTELLTPEEALAGFSDPVVLMIAGLFIIGGGLSQTGVANALGQILSKLAGKSEGSLIAVTMLAVALLSAFMSSSGATAVLLPAVFSMAWNARIPPSKVLMPLAFGALIGGMLTLIGTPPNLVVSNELAAQGLSPFSFFSFAPVGLIILAVGIGFMVLLGRHMLPVRKQNTVMLDYVDQEDAPTLNELVKSYQLPDNFFHVRVRRTSPLVNATLADANLRARYHVNVIEIQSWPDRQAPPTKARPVEPETVLKINDILHVQGAAQDVTWMAHQERMSLRPITPAPSNSPIISQEIGMVELLLTPRSQLIGRTLQETRFRDKYDVTVLSLRRLGEPVKEDPATVRLRFGDTMLVLGTWKRIRLLQGEGRDFVVVGQPQEMLAVHRTPKRALIASFIMIAMLIMMTFNILPSVAAVLLASIAMILTNCLTMEQAYSAMNWQSVVLLAGMLPMATALQKTGGVQYIAASLTASLGQLGPLAVMAGLFILTSLFSLFISNTATTVLMAPIAYQTAVALGVTPHAFLMTVALAASSAFATPVATMSGTMVMAPGGYRFEDYVRVGVVLQVLVMLVSLLILPLRFPF